MEPNPAWDADAHEETVATFAALAEDEDVTVTVWGRDSCGDCRRELPDFAAALDAAGFPEERVREIPVDDEKRGELVEEYGVEYIATIVIEREAQCASDADELARFVEKESVPAADYLARTLREREALA